MQTSEKSNVCFNRLNRFLSSVQNIWDYRKDKKKQRNVKGDIEAHIINEFHHTRTALGG